MTREKQHPNCPMTSPVFMDSRGLGQCWKKPRLNSLKKKVAPHPRRFGPNVVSKPYCSPMKPAGLEHPRLQRATDGSGTLLQSFSCAKTMRRQPQYRRLPTHLKWGEQTGLSKWFQAWNTRSLSIQVSAPQFLHGFLQICWNKTYLPGRNN